jgi:hypothetical protein
MDGACGMYGGEERCFQNFDGDTERKRPLGRPKCRWEDINRLDLKKRIDVVDWIDLAWFPDKWRAH